MDLKLKTENEFYEDVVAEMKRIYGAGFGYYGYDLTHSDITLANVMAKTFYERQQYFLSLGQDYSKDVRNENNK